MKAILKMYKHLEWANQRLLVHLQETECEDKRIIRLFSHILLAELREIGIRPLGIDYISMVR